MDLYEVLGVGKNATTEEIKREYRKRAKTAHPDHGGDPQEFKMLALAHEVLTDDQRRDRYDQTGSTTAPQLAEIDAMLMGYIGKSVMHDQFVEHARQLAVDDRTKEANAIKQLENTIKAVGKRLQQLRERNPEPNEVVNLIIDCLEADVREMEKGVRHHKDKSDMIDKVLEMLSTVNGWNELAIGRSGGWKTTGPTTWSYF